MSPSRALLTLSMLVSALHLACAPPCEVPPPVDAGTPPPPVVPLTCRLVASEPWTVPVGQPVDVTLHLDCAGGTDAPVQTTLRASYQRRDGTKATVEYDTAFVQGETSAVLRIPGEDIGLDTLALELEPAPGGKSDASWFEWARATTRPELRGHLPAATVAAQWKDVVRFTPTPPAAGAKQLAVFTRDFDGDDTLDALVVWRLGSALTVQTYPGPALTMAATKTFTDARFAVTGTHEAVRFARRRGATSDKTGALAWNAVDATAQEGRAATIDVTSGVATTHRSFDTAGYPKVEAVIGADVVVDATVADGAAPEVLFVYRGDAGGTKGFVTLVSQAVSGKFMQLANAPTWGGTTPDQHAAGQVTAGLLRSWKVTGRLTEPVDVGNVLGWTVGASRMAGLSEVRRVFLAGAEAGNLSGSVTFPQAASDEAEFDVQALDAFGDGANDVLLSSVRGAGRAPVLRLWSVNGSGLIDPALQTLEVPDGVRAGPGTPRLLSSVQAPYQLALRRPGVVGPGLSGFFEGTLGDETYAVEVGWAPQSGTAPAFVAPVALSTRAQLKGVKAAGVAVAAVQPDGALNFGVRDVEDRVLLASHPNGTRVLASGRGGGRWQPEGVSDWQQWDWKESSQMLLFGDSTTPGNTFVVLRDEPEGGDSTWTVYLATPLGLEGPATVRIPAALGRFVPMGLEGDALRLTRPGPGRGGQGQSGRFETVSWTTAELTQAVRGGSVVTVDSGSITLYDSVLRPAPGRGSLLAAEAKIKEERALKQRQQMKYQHETMRAAAPGTTEVVAVLGVDEADACPFRTVLYTGDPATEAPVTLSESSAAGCLDLAMPVAVADFCGVGGQQVLTMEGREQGGDTLWNFHVWMRGGMQAVGVPVGEVAAPKGVEPRVSAADVNGDGAADVLVAVPGQPTAVFFNDGLGGSFGGQSIAGLSDVVRAVPGAGPGLGGGQVACGAGLQCNLGTGTRTSSSQASNKAELL